MWLSSDAGLLNPQSGYTFQICTHVWESETVQLDQTVMRSHVNGLVTSFEIKAA